MRIAMIDLKSSLEYIIFCARQQGGRQGEKVKNSDRIFGFPLHLVSRSSGEHKAAVHRQILSCYEIRFR